MVNQNSASSRDGLLCESALKNDWVFAIFYIFLGYGFLRTFWGFGGFNEKLALFTVVYALTVLAYIYISKKVPVRESWFWLAVMLAVGIFYGLWSAMPLLQVLALFLAAAYWTLSATGNLLKNGRTSEWVVVDSINAMMVVPFSNLLCHGRILKQGLARTKPGKQLMGAGLGICIAIPVLGVAIMLLSRADAGFSSLMQSFWWYLLDNLMKNMLQLLISLPVAAYLFGLIYGGIHKQNTRRFDMDKSMLQLERLHAVPDIAIRTALILVCALYLLFIGLQSRYLFSAFAGVRPENFTYAEYARRGFFELCLIAVLNLAVILGANTFCKTKRSEHRMLQWLNKFLAMLTLILILTAFSKMILYIWAYQFTVKRILTSVFMIWLMIVFTMIIVHQRRDIPLVRYSVFSGAVCFCLLCVVPLEWSIAQLNAVL